jgi:O-6-methylguanine DNA methyltransferase
MENRSSINNLRNLSGDLQMAAAVETPVDLAPNVLMRVGLADIYWTVDTAIGEVFIAASDRGISGVAGGTDSAAFETAHLDRTGRPAKHLEQPPERLMRDVTAALSGDRRRKPAFDLRGLSEFEEAVLRKALEIPRGEVRPYAWVAREIGHPGASRAVGTALANNPVPLLIPCHRVVRGDGVIGNYLFGTEAKHALLESEQADPDALMSLSRRGIRYFGSDTTNIFCFPTCRHARRTSDEHLVSFASEHDARSAGYRPCKVCRPALAG